MASIIKTPLPSANGVTGPYCAAPRIAAAAGEMAFPPEGPRDAGPGSLVE